MRVCACVSVWYICVGGVYMCDGVYVEEGEYMWCNIGMCGGMCGVSRNYMRCGVDICSGVCVVEC